MSGYGSGDGYGSGYGSGDGYGDGYGDGSRLPVSLGKLVGYQVTAGYGLLKVGCQCWPVTFWQRRWSEVAAKHGEEISSDRANALILAALRVPASLRIGEVA